MISCALATGSTGILGTLQLRPKKTAPVMIQDNIATERHEFISSNLPLSSPREVSTSYRGRPNRTLQSRPQTMAPCSWIFRGITSRCPRRESGDLGREGVIGQRRPIARGGISRIVMEDRSVRTETPRKHYTQLLKVCGARNVRADGGSDCARREPFGPYPQGEFESVGRGGR